MPSRLSQTTCLSNHARVVWARQNRVHIARAEAAAWYDTILRGWVVRLPFGPDAGNILPLEIRWYDAPPALVHTAAAVLVDAAGHPLTPPHGPARVEAGEQPPRAGTGAAPRIAGRRQPARTLEADMWFRQINSRNAYRRRYR
jgi:hypothetical protein